MTKSNRVLKKHNIFEGIYSYHIAFPESAKNMHISAINNGSSSIHDIIGMDRTINNESAEKKEMSLQVSVSGTMDIFPINPVSEYARNNLFYIESCSLFSSEKHSATIRKNYDSYLILFTYEGEGVLHYEGKKYHLKQGDGFFIDCKKPHAYHTFGDFWKHSTLHLQGHILSDFYDMFSNEGKVIFHQDPGGNYQQLLEKLLRINAGDGNHIEWNSSNCISDILTELLHQVSIKEDLDSDTEKHIRILLRYLEQNFYRQITLDQMAEVSGFSKYYMTRKFKDITGYPPNDYLIRIRIRYACTLLKTTDLSVKEISMNCGFTDINNFNRRFRIQMGIAPGDYRRKFL